ncbi:hypothetical protein D082_08760 [Synechocystis sp. PCC 6714]|nr:hypothetical protein D082_08760 [Synechocystis sp. PCC 6714]
MPGVIEVNTLAVIGRVIDDFFCWWSVVKLESWKDKYFIFLGEIALPKKTIMPKLQ